MSKSSKLIPAPKSFKFGQYLNQFRPVHTDTLFEKKMMRDYYWETQGSCPVSLIEEIEKLEEEENINRAAEEILLGGKKV